MFVRSSSVGFGPGTRHARGRVGRVWYREWLSVPIFGHCSSGLVSGLPPGTLFVWPSGVEHRRRCAARRSRPSRVASAALLLHGPSRPGPSPGRPSGARPPATRGDHFGDALNTHAEQIDAHGLSTVRMAFVGFLADLEGLGFPAGCGQDREGPFRRRASSYEVTRSTSEGGPGTAGGSFAGQHGCGSRL